MRHKPIANIADIVVLATLTVLNPFGPFARQQRLPHIPDKAVTFYVQQLPADSLRHALQLCDSEISEMEYYLHVHNVTDQGYNLIASYANTLQQRKHRLQTRLDRWRSDSLAGSTFRRHLPAESRSMLIPAKERPMVAVKTGTGHWYAGHYYLLRSLSGEVLVRDSLGSVVSAVFAADSILTATRRDSTGTYHGQMNHLLQPSGQGSYDADDGSHFDGFWADGRQEGFGFESSPHHPLRVGEWKAGKFLGERMSYTAERIYGIDISRHQHEKGRRRYAISWPALRITSLGSRHAAGGQTFPVSFVYIKATEGTTIKNRYYQTDRRAARRQGIHVGAYHFFSLKSTPQAQAAYFLKHAAIQPGDFPPVLDVEPSEAQIRQVGGADEVMRRVRIFLQTVEQRTGHRPILYVSQMFVNQHMQHAADVKQHYNIWIARYGQYKPDVRLVFWQLSPDGRVKGITGPVDINVFNGYQAQWHDFLRTGFHQ